MKLYKRCEKCIYDKKKPLSDDEAYQTEIKDIIYNHGENDSSSYIAYRCDQVYEKISGMPRKSYTDIKKRFNDLVLSMEGQLRKQIEESRDPLARAMAFARIGNYIDFSVFHDIDDDEFLSLFEKAECTDMDMKTLESFKSQCSKAGTFLLVADNCGEIVLDKLFLEQLMKLYPHLDVSIMVRGAETMNDVTAEDAEYVGIDKYGRIISNGNEVPATVYDLCSDEAKEALDHTDVILSKGQGNYETLSEEGRHIFYSLLCKCDVFVERFRVPLYSGIFTEEFE
ncbi:MAG: DUF89 family protein [Erysipelotrichaceae bacterium]|nr:DUF89 family protein [Erysipelotrichaceae bacterium]